LVLTCTFPTEGYPSAYGRPSVVRPAQAYRSTVWRRSSLVCWSLSKWYDWNFNDLCYAVNYFIKTRPTPHSYNAIASAVFAAENLSCFSAFSESSKGQTFLATTCW